jgi:hypothetical protein
MNNIDLSHFSIELSAPGVTWNASCPATFDTQTITDTIPPGGSVGAWMYIITSCPLPVPAAADPPTRLSVTARSRQKAVTAGRASKARPSFSQSTCALAAFRWPTRIRVGGVPLPCRRSHVCVLRRQHEPRLGRPVSSPRPRRNHLLLRHYRDGRRNNPKRRSMSRRISSGRHIHDNINTTSTSTSTSLPLPPPSRRPAARAIDTPDLSD